MWKPAIQAVKTSDETWIKNNRKRFYHFFEEENERPAGKLGKAAMAHHYEERLFKMFLGKSYDGLELALDKGSKWIEHCAVLNPNWGWLLGIGVGGAYFADYMPAETARHYFLQKEALVAGSGKPDGAAVKLGGDRWQVNGTWSYCSGSEQASFFTAVTFKDKQPSAFILPVEQAQLQRDWNAIGLPLTCSHTILAKNTAIPEDHFFDLSESPRTSAYPLSTYPFMLFAQICFVPVVVGIARGFWLEAEKHLQDKEAVWKEFQPDRYASIKGEIKEHSGAISNLKAEFYELVAASWREHLAGRSPKEEEVTEMGISLAEYCYKTISAILPKLGMGVLDKGHPLQKQWQDLQTAYQHTAFHRY